MALKLVRLFIDVLSSGHFQFRGAIETRGSIPYEIIIIITHFFQRRPMGPKGSMPGLPDELKIATDLDDVPRFMDLTTTGSLYMIQMVETRRRDPF